MRETGESDEGTGLPDGEPVDSDALREGYLARLSASAEHGEGTDEVVAAEGTDEVGEADEEPEAPESPEALEVPEAAEVRREAHEIVQEAQAGVERWGEEDRERAREWFGNDEEETRERLADVLGKIDASIDGTRLVDQSEDPEREDDDEPCFAYVYPSGEGGRTVYLGEDWSSATGEPPDSRAGILVHEASHFSDVAETHDRAYGREACAELARTDPEAAAACADNIEYFVESYQRAGRQHEG